MTFLLVTDDADQGRALAGRLDRAMPGSLCLTVAPRDLEASLREVRVDCVVCPADLAEGRPDRRPRFVAWPERGMQEAWVQALLRRAALWEPPNPLF